MSTIEQWMISKLKECQDDPEYLRAYIEILEGELELRRSKNEQENLEA
ncbi:MAG: hypothetical protein ABIG63_08700 [Chloroflexota bacterium]